MFFSTDQANIMLGVGVIPIVVLIYLYFTNRQYFRKMSPDGSGMFDIGFIVLIIALIINVLLNAFNVNCVVEGECNIWSWILVIAFLLAQAGLLFGLYQADVSLMYPLRPPQQFMPIGPSS